MSHLTAARQAGADRLARDLERVFGPRLRALVAYAAHQSDPALHTLAIVDDLSFADLSALVPLADGWRRHGVAVPLMLSQDELLRTLDIYPMEYAGIMATAVTVRGSDPFAGVSIPIEDVRRACEVQAKSHLIHLREGYVETHGEATSIGSLIAASAAPLRVLLTNLARLPEDGGALAPEMLSDDALAAFAERRIGVPAAVVREVFQAASSEYSAIADQSALLARYIDAAERLWDYADRWRAV